MKAADFLAAGLNVIPIPFGQKRSINRWKVYQTRMATRAELQSWTRERTNLAIVTGEISGVVVVDLDSPEALQWAEKHLPVSPTRTLTGLKEGGWRGQHWFYRHPGPGKVIANTARVRLSDGGLIELDLRGDGGYVLAPGSAHPSGVAYEALGDWTPRGLANLPDFPTSALPAPPQPPPGARKSEPPTRMASDNERAVMRMRRYVATIPPVGGGERNSKAFAVACKILDFCALAGPEAETEFAEWCRRCNPPLPESEIEQTWRSSLKSRQNRSGWRMDEDAPRSTPGAPGCPGAPGRDEIVVDPGLPPVAPPPRRKKSEEPTPELPQQDYLPKEVCAEDGYTYTDSGNAQRLADFYRSDLRYVLEWKSWLIWNGRRWEVDEAVQAKLRIQQFFELLLVEHCANARYRAHMLESLEARGINAALSTLQYQKGIPISSDEVDRGHWIFNASNGTIDLRTGQLRPFAREDLMLVECPVSYDPKAECPRWLKFLADITRNDVELQRYLQRVCGYALTGSTREQCFFFLYGIGHNGKSTFLYVLEKLLGGYSRTANIGTFQAERQDAVRTDIARLVGARLVVASEAEEGKPLAMALLKHLTGEEKVTARFLYSKEFEYLPTFKIFFTGNHKPPIRDTSFGAWRRLQLVPFLAQIPKEKVDLDLKSKLEAELPGVLAWAVQGCLQWQQVGLAPPKIVSNAVRAYQDEQDPIGQFLSDRCVVGHYDYYRTTASALFREYTEWCQEVGERPWTQRSLHGALESKRYEKRKIGKQNLVHWVGIGLRSEISNPGDGIQPSLEGLDPSMIPG